MRSSKQFPRNVRNRPRRRTGGPPAAGGGARPSGKPGRRDGAEARQEAVCQGAVRQHAERPFGDPLPEGKLDDVHRLARRTDVHPGELGRPTVTALEERGTVRPRSKRLPRQSDDRHTPGTNRSLINDCDFCPNTSSRAIYWRPTAEFTIDIGHFGTQWDVRTPPTAAGRTRSRAVSTAPFRPRTVRRPAGGRLAATVSGPAPDSRGG